MEVSREVLDWLAPALGEVCNEISVGRTNSLNLGFGKGVSDPIDGCPDRMSYEWMIGTFNAAWRVTDGKTVITGSKQSVDRKNVELSLQDVFFGRLVGVEMISTFDVRLKFSSGLYVEFFAAANLDDEILYVIGPGGVDAGYSYLAGWSFFGKSSQ